MLVLCRLTGSRARASATPPRTHRRARQDVGVTRMPYLVDRLQGFGTTVFAEMSALAVATGSINLGQGFPHEPRPPEGLDVARAAIRTAPDQYPPRPGLAEPRQAGSGHPHRFP